MNTKDRSSTAAAAATGRTAPHSRTAPVGIVGALRSFFGGSGSCVTANSGDLLAVHAESPQRDDLTVTEAVCPVSRRPFDYGFAIRKTDMQIQVQDFGGFETRNPSTFRMMLAAVRAAPSIQFPWILVNTGDRDVPAAFEGLPVFSYSTRCKDYASACPDFVFDHWKQTQLDDYESLAGQLAETGSLAPATDQLGWRGANTHPVRKTLVKLDDKRLFDVEFISWNRRDPERLTSRSFISLPDQVRRWRYLIDVEGMGYSGRLKLFFFSQRAVFIQQRPFEEWYFADLEPWVHYVPVRRDLSDLVAALCRLREHPDLEAQIISNAYRFATTRLTRTAAVARWKEMLSRCCVAAG